MSELSKNEIRIGNYLISKMMGILKVQMIPIDIDMSNYEPIKLTEEWLINLGFEETDYAGGCYYLGSIQIDLSDFECAFKTNWLDCKVKYVHQLQNLYFALTGKELTHQKIN